MSQAISPSNSQHYGLARVARVWRQARATVYRHRDAREAPTPAPAPARRRGPIGACPDDELLEHIRAEIHGSKFHGATARSGHGSALAASVPPRAGSGV